METEFKVFVICDDVSPIDRQPYQKSSCVTFYDCKQAIAYAKTYSRYLIKNGYKNVRYTVTEVTHDIIDSSDSKLRFNGTIEIDGKRRPLRFDSAVKLLDYLDSVLVDSDVNCTFFSVRKYDPSNV